VLALILALLPLTLLAQAPAPQAPAAKPAAPKTWADAIINQDGYATPPKEVAEAVLAPRWQNVSLTNLSPDKKWFLNQIGDGPVPMSTFSKPFDELGGVFVDFKANRARTLTISNNVGIQVISATDGTKKPVAVPPNVRISNAIWVPDGSGIAYFAHTDDATNIWITDLATNKPRQVTPKPVLATLVTSFGFTRNGKQIATVLVPDNRSPKPVAPASPTGPEVKVSESNDKNRLSTFASLMSMPWEFTLLEWHATGQLALIDVPPAPAPGAKPVPKPTPKPAAAKGVVPGLAKIGQPAMIRSIDLSPDGKYLRVTRMTRPFSFIVPVGSFGSIEEVWDGAGKPLTKIRETPINLGVQDDTQPPPDPAAGGGRGGAAEQGKRELAWRADGEGITYLEQEPAPAGEAAGAGRAGAAAGRGGAAPGGRGATTGGQAGRGQAAQRKDRLFQWLPPFEDKSAKLLYENLTRMTGHRFSPDMQTLLWRETSGQNTIEYALNLKDTTQKYTLARFATDDQAANPGTIITARGAGGGGRGGAPAGGRGGGGAGGGIVQLSADGSSVFYQGTVYDKNPEQVGPKSFVDKVAIKTGEKKRIYEGDNNNVFESIASPLDLDAVRFVVERQSPTQAPQFYLLEGGNRRQLTENKDLFPDLTAAQRVRVPIERQDGFKFKVTIMLPADYKTGTRLPALFWLYPREFSTQDEFDRPDRTYNKNTFTNYNARSMQFLVRLGYAVVVDTPALPIVGPTGQQNNNYVNDLRNGLSAVIDELERRGYIDRTRLAIGGHSYGAFTTVNAMVHTPFFKAGIAGDGAYNRTLTPLGFQSERRDLWAAPNVYLGMSPFLYANNLTGALLMYHGLHDQNVGTDPVNSERLMHALNGLGKIAAMYRYPLEDHGPAAKETLLDLWARWTAWLDKYVKNPQKPAVTKPATEAPASEVIR
jgi:dipeptidyl aminopeptidase/acylaminoacyl peptidase